MNKREGTGGGGTEDDGAELERLLGVLAAGLSPHGAPAAAAALGEREVLKVLRRAVALAARAPALSDDARAQTERLVEALTALAGVGTRAPAGVVTLGPLRRLLCAHLVAHVAAACPGVLQGDRSIRMLVAAPAPAPVRSLLSSASAAAAAAAAVNQMTLVTYDRLVDLLLALGASERAYRANIANVSHWLAAAEPALRHRVMPLLARAARVYGPALPDAVVQQAGDTLQHVLLHAAPATLADAAAAAAGGGYFGGAALPQTQQQQAQQAQQVQQVFEPDGSIARDFFTVLCTPHTYSYDQHMNHHAFAVLYNYLSAVYLPRAPQQQQQQQQQGAGRRADPHVLEAVVQYCQRVMEQARTSSSGSSNGAAAVALGEALRVLGLVCRIDAVRAARLLPSVRRSAALLCASPSDGLVLMRYMQFFVDHSTAETLAADLEPLAQTFFEAYFPYHYHEQVLCFALLDFCLANVQTLTAHTRLLATYFPSLLKAVAWHTFALYADFMELLPALVTPTTFAELLHALFDLPLLAAALEQQQARRINEANFGFAPEESASVRALGHHVLRGVAEGASTSFTFCSSSATSGDGSSSAKGFWEREQTAVTVQQYFHACPVTERVQAASRLVRPAVARVLDIVLGRGTAAHAAAVVLVLFARYDPRTMFPSSDFRKDVQALILARLQQIFEARPALTATLQRPIVSLLSNTATRDTLGELVLTMIWVVGEYLTPALAAADLTRDALNDYYEALELFVFEQISAVKAVLAESARADGGSVALSQSVGAGASTGAAQDSEEAFSTRLALVVISALSKFAARWQFFSSRVVICLSKLAAIADHMHPAVGARTSECITVLKYPSIAAAVMAEPRARGAPLTDANAPLPFILEQYQRPPAFGSDRDAPSLHPYTLAAIDPQPVV